MSEIIMFVVTTFLLGYFFASKQKEKSDKKSQQEAAQLKKEITEYQKKELKQIITKKMDMLSEEYSDSIFAGNEDEMDDFFHHFIYLDQECFTKLTIVIILCRDHFLQTKNYEVPFVLSLYKHKKHFNFLEFYIHLSRTSFSKQNRYKKPPKRSLFHTPYYSTPLT